MIPSVEDLVRRTSEDFQDELNIDAGLDKVARKIARADSTVAAIGIAKKELGERTRKLKDAQAKLAKLRAAVARVEDVLAFTLAGWPEREAQLEQLFGTDPLGGLTAWLRDWFSAASYCRFEALARLETVGGFPRGASLLLERCASARLGLQRHSWYVARQMLETGVAGITINGNDTVPEPSVKTDLAVLRIRLALDQGLLEEADEALTGVESSAPSPAIQALRARSLRLSGDPQSALGRLQPAASAAPADLDVAIELIEHAHASGDDETVHASGNDEIALDYAREAVAALPVLVDFEAELARLVTPPPAEIWVAVGERALRERDFDVLAKAVESGNVSAAPASTLRATLAELNARGAAARRESTEERVQALLDAGIQRVQAGQTDLAAALFEQLLRLAPGHQDGSLRLADCLVTLSSGQPLASVRSQLNRALDLIRSAQSGGVEQALTWSYLSKAAAHELLSSAVTADAPQHAWEAILASFRSLVRDDIAVNRWQELSIAAQVASLYQVAVAAGARGHELAPDDSGAAAYYIQALVNAHEMNEALELLGEPADSWDRAVKAYILIHTGDPQQAIGLLRAANPDPNWSWATQALVAALLMVGQYDEAVARARDLRNWWIERLDETSGAWSSAWASIVLGDYEKAQELTSALPDEDQDAVRAAAGFLQGDSAGAAIALGKSIRSTRTLVDLKKVTSIWLPQVAAIARYREVPPPDIDAVRADLETREAELERFRDPLQELAHAPVPGADSEAAAVARAMGIGLLCLARDEAEAGLNAVQAAADLYPQDVDLAALRDALANKMQSLTAVAPSPPASASDVLGPSPAADRVVARTDPPPLDGVPEAESMAATDTQPRYQLALPSSWFAGYDDPLKDHPLFVRYIPQIRFGATWEVPEIHVRAEDELEPDQFRLFALDELVDEGRVSPDFLYAPDEALRLLDVAPEESAGRDDVSRLMRISKSTIRESSGLAELLTMPAMEVVARRMASVMQSRIQPIPEAHAPWRRRLYSVFRGRSPA